MNAQTAFDLLVRGGLMAGMRGDFPPAKALPIVRVLYEEGIRVFEFTMNSTQAIESMQAVKAEFGDEVVSGMGTVLDIATAQRVLDAGADMLVSPAFSAEVVKLVVAADVLMGPGVITPTECVDAWALGVKFLKFFPIGAMGVDYFKSVRAPLDHMQFLANGGINPETTRTFIQAGAMAVGASNWLTGDGSMPLETLRTRAQQLREAVEEARGTRVKMV